MKIWKTVSLVTFLFLGIMATVVVISCERNVCNNVTCFNGGSCGGGTCNCPVGYEGSQCQTLSVSRFVGGYAGTHQCITSINSMPETGGNIIDSVWITADKNPGYVNFVYVSVKSLQPALLHGYVNANNSTYSIIIPSDSTNNYLNVFTLTLQNNKYLNLHNYLTDERTPGDTTIQQCTYVLTKFQ